MTTFIPTTGEQAPPFDRARWMADALCREVGPDPFFPELGDSTRPAKAVCALCPVKAECLDYAMSLPFRPAGIWGGTSRAERQRMRAAS